MMIEWACITWRVHVGFGVKLLIWFGEFNHGEIESLWFYMMTMHAGKLNGYDFMQLIDKYWNYWFGVLGFTPVQKNLGFFLELYASPNGAWNPSRRLMLKQPSLWVSVKNRLAVKRCRQAMRVVFFSWKMLFFVFSRSKYRRALVLYRQAPPIFLVCVVFVKLDFPVC